MAWVKERITSDGVKRYVACYRDPEGRQRSAGTFSSNRAAERAGNREEQRVLAGSWRDHSLGEVRFRDYVEDEWLPSKHIEPTTKAAYVSNLTKHFFPFFGRKQLHQITPGLVQDWVTKAAAGGLSARSIRKYHTMLHSIFARAVRDGLVVANPCAHTELPKVIVSKTPTLTPAEFDLLIAAIPDRYRLMVETAIETGMRWGELIALRPRHVDFLRKSVTVQDTIMEVSKRHSPTGERYVAKALPQGQRAPDLRREPGLARPGRRAHQHPGPRPRRPALRHLRGHPDLAQHLPHPDLAARGQSQRGVLQRSDARPAARPRLLAARRRLRPRLRHGPPRTRPHPDHREIPPRPRRRRPEEPERARPDPQVRVAAGAC